MWLLEAIDWAMEIDAQLRPASTAELRDALLNQSGRPAVSAMENRGSVR
jgi:hypothetical protein